MYGGLKLFERLPNRSWLDLRDIQTTNYSLYKRLLWQSNLDNIIEQEKTLLFIPGGTYLGKYRPFVTMFQNMQIFENVEKNQEG